MSSSAGRNFPFGRISIRSYKFLFAAPAQSLLPSAGSSGTGLCPRGGKFLRERVPPRGRWFW